VLRSWEQRFAAIAIEVAPSAVTVAVLAPPTNLDQALRLAAEHRALSAGPDSGQPGWLRDLANLLLTGKHTPTPVHADPPTRLAS
jgi:hypothetical protein